MAVIVKFKKEQILRCSNSIYGTLFEKITDIIEEENIELNETLKKIYKKLELCDYGYSMDFEPYIQDRKAMLQFLSILSTAIKKFKKDIPGLVPAAEERLWNFHRNLKKIVAEEYK